MSYNKERDTHPIADVSRVSGKKDLVSGLVPMHYHVKRFYAYIGDDVKMDLNGEEFVRYVNMTTPLVDSLRDTIFSVPMRGIEGDQIVTINLPWLTKGSAREGIPMWKMTKDIKVSMTFYNPDAVQKAQRKISTTNMGVFPFTISDYEITAHGYELNMTEDIPPLVMANIHDELCARTIQCVKTSKIAVNAGVDNSVISVPDPQGDVIDSLFILRNDTTRHFAFKELSLSVERLRIEKIEITDTDRGQWDNRYKIFSELQPALCWRFRSDKPHEKSSVFGCIEPGDKKEIKLYYDSYTLEDATNYSSIDAIIIVNSLMDSFDAFRL